jgi:hypothetical protein
MNFEASNNILYMKLGIDGLRSEIQELRRELQDLKDKDKCSVKERLYARLILPVDGVNRIYNLVASKMPHFVDIVEDTIKSSRTHGVEFHISDHDDLENYFLNGMPDVIGFMSDIWRELPLGDYSYTFREYSKRGEEWVLTIKARHLNLAKYDNVIICVFESDKEF